MNGCLTRCRFVYAESTAAIFQLGVSTRFQWCIAQKRVRGLPIGLPFSYHLIHIGDAPRKNHTAYQLQRGMRSSEAREDLFTTLPPKAPADYPPHRAPLPFTRRRLLWARYRVTHSHARLTMRSFPICGAAA